LLLLGIVRAIAPDRNYLRVSYVKRQLECCQLHHQSIQQYEVSMGALIPRYAAATIPRKETYNSRTDSEL